MNALGWFLSLMARSARLDRHADRATRAEFAFGPRDGLFTPGAGRAASGSKMDARTHAPRDRAIAANSAGFRGSAGWRGA